MDSRVRSAGIRGTPQYRFAIFSGLAVVFALLAFKRFSTWQPHGLWGDDFSNFVSFSLGGWLDVLRESFLETYASRYRPVFGVAWGAWRGLFGMNYDAYAASLCLLHGINAALVFAMAHRLSGRNWLIALAVAVVFANSRFALFQVTMLTGMIEALSMAFFLAMLWCIVAIHQEPERIGSTRWLAVAAFVATVFTHERYLAATPLLSAALWLCSQGSPARVALALAPWIVFAANYGIKTVMVDTGFMQGTGGHLYSFDLERTIIQSREAFRSLLGMNTGQDYLVGAQSMGWIKRIGQLFGLGFVVVVAFAAWRASVRQRVVVLGLAVLAALLLGPPILTIRLEQRWLLAPTALMLLALAWAVGVSRARWVLPVALMSCAALFVVDMVLSRSFGNTFIGYGAAMARFSTQVAADGSAGPPGTPLLLHTNPDGCASLVGGEVFNLLEGQPRAMTCIHEEDEAHEAAAQRPGVPFFVPVDGAARLTFRREMPH